MNKNETIRNIFAGAFFIGGLCLLVLFILTLGKDKGLTESKFQIPVVFNNIGGLDLGAPVYLSGVTVGGVAAINFLDHPYEGRRVQVTLNIFEKYRKQFEHPLQVAVETEGVLGEKIVQIEIMGDTPQALPPPEKPFVGQDPLDVTDLAEEFSKAADSFTKTANELSQIDIVELAQVMRDSSKALLVTSQGINEIMDQLQEITFKSKRLFDRIEEKVIEGQLFKVF